MPENQTLTSRLDSWKDIASYLGRDVRTVIRWEKAGLPVHRVPGGKRRAVFAYPAEIDHWLYKRGDDEEVADQEDGEVEDPSLTSVATSGKAEDLVAEVIRKPEIASLKQRRMIFLPWGLLLLAAICLGGYGALRVLNKYESLRVTKITRLSHDIFLKAELATDGTNLFFNEHRNGKDQVSWMPIAGGDVRHIDLPFDRAILADNSVVNGNLLVLGYGGREEEVSLWVVPVNGQPARRVGDFICHSAAWLDDGKSIAYSRGKSIFLTQNEGLTSRELYRFDSIPIHLHWSKSQERLRFELRSLATLAETPWEMELGKAFDVRGVSLLTGAPDRCCERWAETSNYEFTTALEGKRRELWAIRKQRRWWQPATAHRVELPSAIYAGSGLTSDPRTGRLFTVSGERTGVEFVRFEPFSSMSRTYLPGVGGLYLDFSRDGQWVTYKQADDDSLWISSADGRERKQLVSSFSDLILPRWSPDGTRIAFMAKRSGRPWRIYIVPRVGGEPRELSTGEDNQGGPTWSPDGKWIAYANVLCEGTGDCAVHRIKVDSGEIDTLPGSAGLRTARWSPDGLHIAALRPLQHELLIFDTRNQTWTKLTDGIVGDDLSWSPDSKYLYSDRPTGDKPQILRFPISGGRPASVLDMESLSNLGFILEDGLCVATDGSIILSREINSSEIYALDWSSQ